MNSKSNWRSRIHFGTIMLTFFAALAYLVNPCGAADRDPEPAPFPAPNYTYTNNRAASLTVTYSCGSTHSGSIDVKGGSSVTFEGSCAPDDSDCLECGMTQLIVDGDIVFSRAAATAYWGAYGLDLVAEGFTSIQQTRKEKALDVHGKQMREMRWAIPVVDANGKLADWDFTTTKPRFSVEDDEVVIRDERGKKIGGPEGILKPPCPQGSFTFDNRSDHPTAMTFECADSNGDDITVQPGGAVKFEPGCAPLSEYGPESECIDCRVTLIVIDPIGVYYECEP